MSSELKPDSLLISKAAVKLLGVLLHTQEGPGSNVGIEAEHPNFLRCFPQLLEPDDRIAL